MKKLAFVFIFFTSAYFVNAQANSFKFIPKSSLSNNYKKFHFYNDSISLLKTYKLQTEPYAFNQPYNDNMPVGGKIPPPVFLENNGKGFDLYQSSLDEMIIAKPDATFHSNMPVGNLKIITVPPGKK